MINVMYRSERCSSMCLNPVLILYQYDTYNEAKSSISIKMLTVMLTSIHLTCDPGALLYMSSFPISRIHAQWLQTASEAWHLSYTVTMAKTVFSTQK
jgi:hypothetical protein